ncbi:MAG: DUF4412 domain-containing protein [Bacteroidota bacterium]
MKTRSIFLLLALLILLPGVSNAQLGFVRNKLNKAINKEVDNKIDTAIDKSERDSRNNAKENEQSDQNESDKSSTQDNSGTKGTGRGLFGGKIDIKYNDEYKFTGRLYMQVETYDKKDVIKSDYYVYFNSNTLNSGFEVKIEDPKEGEKSLPSVFLFDNDNKCFLMLIENSDSKTGIISTIPSDSAIAALAKTQKGETPAQPTITKTGNSRTIAGYKCDEYKIIEAEKDGYSNVWMTKDVVLKADKRNWGKTGIPTYSNYPDFEGAMMLAMEAYDKKSQPEMKMETKEINENFGHSISTTGYTFMKMNFGQAGKK